MKLLELVLKNFRNYDVLDINFKKNKTLIVGDNAQGKTNILESIYILSGLKTPRTTNFSDLIQFKKDFLDVNVKLQKNDTDIELGLTYYVDKKRELKINGLKTTPHNFKSVLKVVLFTTKDLLLLRGTPQDRREWLDRAISQVYPAYDERLNKYDKLRIQKSNLLKSENIDYTLLDIYDEQLSVCGANIVYLRKKYLKEIEVIAKEKHSSINNNEQFSINYSNPANDIEEICAYIKSEINAHRQEELMRHQVCVGPHRDDVEFLINDLNAVKYASQGQQRTLVLALKLAELDIIKSKTGFPPVLLLDDVMAELDNSRQVYLLESINNDVQTIITSVDSEQFNETFLNDVDICRIKDGKIVS